ncbi:MAG TPA: PEP-CTERM sorting domain-containing protein [Myxococcota bacterium]|nr:PEP-CTERM sorting domain-containing protein [Myxococcota bacterium]
MHRRFSTAAWSVLAAAAVLICANAGARAASFTLVTSQAGLGANDFIDWGQLGPDDSFAANPSPVTSSLGSSFTLSKTQSDDFTRFDQLGCCGLVAPPPVASGDHLIMTNDQGNNANSIIVAGSMYAAGSLVFAVAQGDFIARITAYDSIGDVLASFIVNGSTNPSGYGTGLAPFLGIVSDAPFAKVGFSLDSATGDTAYLGIDTLFLRTTPAPEPESLALLGLGVAGLLLVTRRQRTGA